VHQAYQRLLDTGKVRSIVLMTQFACADDPQDSMSAEQIECFDAPTKDLPGARSLCNSYWPQARRDWRRPGLMLYGIPPHNDELPRRAALVEFLVDVVHCNHAGMAAGAAGVQIHEHRYYCCAFRCSCRFGLQAFDEGERTGNIGRMNRFVPSRDCHSLRTSAKRIRANRSPRTGRMGRSILARGDRYLRARGVPAAHLEHLSAYSAL